MLVGQLVNIKWVLRLREGALVRAQCLQGRFQLGLGGAALTLLPGNARAGRDWSALPSYLLQDDADQSAGALVDDALKRLLQAAACLLRHVQQLCLHALADQLVQALTENIGAPQLAGVGLKVRQQAFDKLLPLLLTADGG